MPDVRSLIVLNVPIDGRSITASADDEMPRKDYLLLAESLNADILPAGPTSRRNSFGLRLASFVSQAWRAFRRRNDYDVILSMSEQVGLILALMLKITRADTRHVMVSHYVTPGRKRLLIKYLRVFSHITKIVCYGTTQANFLVDELGVPREKVEVILHPADSEFWKPIVTKPKKRIVSAGMLARDYETLIKAIEGIDVEVVIAAASPWVYTDQGVTGVDIPDTVRFVRCSPSELRELYASAHLVVVPLVPVNIQAGSLVIYESMAMGKPVVTTANGGNTDIVKEGETGLYVPPKDELALRGAILSLLSDPDLAEELGNQARRVVEDGLNLDKYVEQLAQVVREDSMRTNVRIEAA